MSTIADYSVFTKAFLAANNVDFSQLYGKLDQDGNWGEVGGFKAFAVIPSHLDKPLTPREAMNLDLNSDWSKLGTGDMWDRVSCRDADGNFIGNIVRIQPGVREGSIRLVAKVAVPSKSDTADLSVNTFVLVRTDPCTNIDLPIAVATISAGYTLHKHLANGNDPLDDVENASYVSFTINHLNGYTSVDFNPDAYVTYDVTDALSRRVDVLEGKEGIEGLHIAFNSNTGDIILSDSEGHVIDQANLHIDANTIIAEGEEGYKYVKTDRNQDVHSAKAFMLSNFSAFGMDDGKAYETQNASLVREGFNEGTGCNGIRVRWTEGVDTEGGGTPHNEIFCIFLKDGNEGEGTSQGKKYLAWYRQNLQPSAGDPVSTGLFRTASGTPIEVNNQGSKIYPHQPKFGQPEPVYNHDVFVHTVGNSSLADWDECFQLMGFHDGDDIPLGTMLPTLIQDMAAGKFDPEEFIHGVGSQNKERVEAQRKLAKDEMVEYNKRRPALTEDREHGTIIDSSGLDVRSGSITLGCGRTGKDGEFQKINYGIQMKPRFGVGDDHNTYESLDFTISHHTGKVQFDGNGHAAQPGGNNGLVPLTSSTLLSIEAGSYISGAPTCLILAEVTRHTNGGSPNPPEGGSPNPPEGSPVLTPIRMTAGFSVEAPYSASSGLNLTIHDYRDNIAAVFNPNNYEHIPAIIEVQAIYTHLNAQSETVPAQQMHTYIGEWTTISAENVHAHPGCSFLCNKIEEWMTAVGLADTTPAEGVQLYVVIRVY